MATFKPKNAAPTRVRFGILTSVELAQETPEDPPDVVVELGSSATAGAGTLTVTALADAMAPASLLAFYPSAQVVEVTLSASAAKGATSLAVDALPGALAAKSKLKPLNYEFDVEVTTAAASSATTVSVKALKEALADNTVLYLFTGTPQYAVTTDESADGATSISVEPLNEAIANGSIALHKGIVVLSGGTTADDDYSTDENTVTVFSEEAAGYAVGTATSTAWSMSYEALDTDFEAGRTRLVYAAQNAVTETIFGIVYVADGAPAGYVKGEETRCLIQVLGLQTSRPADGNKTFSTTFTGRGKPTVAPPVK